jgi:hypothetical protein
MTRPVVVPQPTGSAGWSGVVPGILSVLWLALFLLWFALTPLSNNREIDRLSLGLVAPELISGVLLPEPRPQGPGWHQLADRVDLVAVALLAWFCAWGWGRGARRWLGVPLGDGWGERLVLDVGLGLAWLAVMTLLLGWCGVMSRPVILGASLLGWVLALWPGRPAELAPRSTTGSDSMGGGRASWWVAAPFVLVITLGALLPSYDFDVNEYHFQGPREYLAAGRIHWLPHNVYTSFPFATEMLTLWSMIVRDDWYRGAVAGKLVLALYGVLTAGAVGAVTRRLFGSTAGVFAGLIWITSPWTCRISTIAYTEGALCFHLAASLLALVLWRQRRAIAPTDTLPNPTARLDARCLLWLGALPGGAMACKYPGLISVVIPSALAVAVFAWRDSQSRFQSDAKSVQSTTGRRALIGRLWPWGLGMALFIGPWLLKNLIETGNPVYPLGWTLFGGADWDAELNAKWRRAHSSTDFSPSSVVALLLEMAGRNDWQTPWLFALAPLAFWIPATRRTAGWLGLLVAWEFFTVWGLTHRLDRFWVPMLPAVAVLAGAGGAWLWNEVSHWGSGRSARMALRAVAVLVCVANFTFAVSPWGGYNGFLESFDSASRFVAEFTAPELVHLNQQLPPGSRVLSIGDAEMFEARFPVDYNTVFDHSLFEQWLGADAPAGADGFPDHALRPFQSVDALRQALADRGITHLYVNWLEILRYRSPGNYGYTAFVSPGRFVQLRELGILDEPWRIETAVMPLEALDPGRREIVREWGDEPTLTRQGQQFLKTFEVFPVRRD